MTEWLPIETAPKDGTPILLYAPATTYQGRAVEHRLTIGHWERDIKTYLGDCGGECRCPEYEYGDPMWLSWDGGFTEEHPPTHWKPLPNPPEQSE